ncbi:MAG: 1-deoxy-D-xylulose-5-phosphate reductoisomerase [Candidatus Omnitrophica bacterium]|nr:1-deoxy-D-xylulose-5-phosphate reductoisomerase [Candidatus Omnitrophota bacterium]
MIRKRIALLGSTGSIGINTLEVISRYPERFEVVLLSAFNNVELLKQQIRQFSPAKVALAAEHIPALKSVFGSKTAFFAVEKDISFLVAEKLVDIVVIAMSGSAALEPFLSAVRAGKVVAPANKEALVIAGDILMNAARQSGARVIPVDSEQSAIFQCIEGHRRVDLRCVHLTASGGALLRVPVSRHRKLSVKQVLKHPRWKMGAKITVDSATLLNKGFEVIEAQRLFALDIDQIKVVIHPQALVHSLVEYIDGSMIAQLGVPDMRIPIQYALTYPERLDSGFPGLDLARLKTLSFEPPDMAKFPALALAFTVARLGGTYPAVLNAADEVAVEAFLAGRLSFTGIYEVVERTVRAHRLAGSLSLKSIKEADAWARAAALGFLRKVK